MENYIILAVVAVILAAAVGYIVKQKKSGAACIGCPDGHSCPHSKNGGCSCHCHK